MYSNKTLFVALFSFIAVMASFFGFLEYKKAEAQFQAAPFFSGFGWTSNYGWVSFDCADMGWCATANYKVTVDASGNLNGYAWVNPHDSLAGTQSVGWLKFGGLSGFPTNDPNSINTNAKLVEVNGIKQLQGWARFCTGTPNPTSCTGGGSHSTSGGWDGWVSLKGTNHGVVINSAVDPANFPPGVLPISGNAWGGSWVDNNGNSFQESNEVVGPGWINMNSVLYHGPTNPAMASMQLYGNGQPANVTLNLSTGDTLGLSWDVYKMKAVQGCVASGNWSGFKNSVDGLSTDGAHDQSFLVNIPGIYTYTLTCTPDPSASSTIPISQTVIVNVTDPLSPPASFQLFGNGQMANVTLTLNTGNSLNLSWNVSNMSSCTASSSPITAGWNGPKNASNINAPFGGHVQQAIVFPAPGTFLFHMNCTPINMGSPKPPQQTVTVNVVGANTPVVTLHAFPNSFTVIPGVPFTNTSTLTWSGQNLNTCEASATAAPLVFTNGGPVDWDANTNPATPLTLSDQKTKVVAPPLSYPTPPNIIKYTITCTTTIPATPTVFADAFVELKPLSVPRKDLRLRIDDGFGSALTSITLPPGQQVQLKWTSGNAIAFDSCVGKTGSGLSDWAGQSQNPDPPLNGIYSSPTVSRNVNQTGQTIFTLTCKESATGNSFDSNPVFVNINEPVPTLLFYPINLPFTPPVGAIPGMVDLKWESTNMKACKALASTPTFPSTDYWSPDLLPVSHTWSAGDSDVSSRNGVSTGVPVPVLPITYRIECLGIDDLLYARSVTLTPGGGVNTGTVKPKFIEF